MIVPDMCIKKPSLYLLMIAIATNCIVAAKAETKLGQICISGSHGSLSLLFIFPGVTSTPCHNPQH